MKRLIIPLFIPLFVSAQTHKGIIAGQVIDAQTESPLAGAIVFLVEKPKLGNATDVEGNFTIYGIEVGEYSLHVSLLGYEPVVVTNVVVSTGHSTKLKVKLQERAIESSSVEVRADYFRKAGSLAPLSTTGFDAAEIRRSPGASQDMQRIVQNLPGVGNSNDQNNELIVRGGAPNENLTVMDYVEIPSTNHYPNQYNSGGPINMVNVDLIEDIQFSTGGFPVQYGDKLSSAMNVTIREGDRRRTLSGELGAHFAGTGGVLEGGFANGKGAWIFSARQSFLEVLDKIVGISTLGITAIPKYFDSQFKLVYDLNPTNKLLFSGIYGDDLIFLEGKTREAVPDKANVSDSVNVQNVDFHSRQYAFGFSWKSLWGSSGYSVLTLQTISSLYDVDVNQNFTARQYDASGLLQRTTLIDRRTSYRNLSTERSAGVNFDAVWQVAPQHELLFGARYQTSWEFDSNVRFDADTIRYDMDRNGSFDSTVVSIPGANSMRLGIGDAYKLALFARDKFRILPELSLTVGVRYDYFSYSGKSSFGPRASLAYELSPAVTTLSLSYGEYYQTQSYPLYGDNRGIGYNRNLDNSHARHFVLGIEHILDEGLKASVEFYRKEYSQLPVNERFQYSTSNRLLRSDKYFNVGGRTSSGLEVFLQQKQVSDLYATVSYSYSKTEDRDPRLPPITAAFPSPYDYPHIFTLAAGKIVKDVRTDADRLPIWLRIPTYLVPLSDDMEISVRFRFQSGNRYTPRHFVTTEQVRIGGRTWSQGYWVESDDINSARYPDYHRLDFQWISRYHFTNYNIEIVFLLENLYNRANVFTENYLSDGTKQTTYQFSFFPVAGVVVQF
jgi:outer membrane receptor for ferrienterochelin and colicin